MTSHVSLLTVLSFIGKIPWADPEGGGRGSGHPSSEKSQKNIGFLSNTGTDPLKNHKAIIQCWAIFGPPAKRNLNGPFIVIFGSSIPSSTKKNAIEFGPHLTKLSGSAHEIPLVYMFKMLNYNI